MIARPPISIDALLPRDPGQGADHVARLLYRTPGLKLLCDLGFLVPATAAGFGLGIPLVGLACIPILGPVGVYMTGGYDQRRHNSTRRILLMGCAVAVFVWPFAALALWAPGRAAIVAVLTGLAIFVSRLGLRASGLLLSRPVRLAIDDAGLLTAYLSASLTTRLGDRAELVDHDADLRLVHGGAQAPGVADFAWFYSLMTGRAVFAEDGAPFKDRLVPELRKNPPAYFAIKRGIDILVSGGMLVLTAPLLLLIWGAIKLEGPGPAFFVQIREGRDGTAMKLRKFRSMRHEKDSGGTDKALWTAKDDTRITTVGRIIRKFRLDELPQLWTIFVGEMSIVGPRPQRKFLNDMIPDTLAEEKAMRLRMSPGLTGWAQVNGGYFGNSHDVEEKRMFEIEKLRYDIYYAAHRSFLMDTRILLLTVKTVLGKKGH